jgi:parvulin-like peptidyl-prolyl isomerase
MNSNILLGVGVAVGLVLAAFGALAPVIEAPETGVVARVNGKSVRAEDLAFALERSGKAESATREQRLEILNQLIDQELLIQRGVAIGLLEVDHTVRKTIAMAMIDAVVAEVLAKEPAEEELRAFYQSHLAVFTTPPRAYVQQLFCSGDHDWGSAYSRAEHAREALARGASFQEVRAQYGDEDNALIPEGLTPLPVLRRLLGPTLSDAMLTMEAGEISTVLSMATGYSVLRLVDRQAEQASPYETARQEVRAEYLRRKRDEALQHYLDHLRQEATIILSPKAPRLDILTKVEPAGES